MFSPKYLIGFLGVTGVGSGITASAFLSKKTNNNEEKRNSVGVLEETPKASPPTFVKKEESEKSEFKGKLLFIKDLEGSFPLGRLGEVFYEGKIFDNEEYKVEKDDEDEEDIDNHITVDISLEKSQEEIESELKKLNKKIK